MRVAIVTESYPPDLNGVANSVARVARHLAANGHQPLVIAPGPAGRSPEWDGGVPVVRLPSLPLPTYANVRLTLPTRRLQTILGDFAPDVVHLASPFVLGAAGAAAAARLDLPTVAVFQTDIPAYLRVYGAAWAQGLAWRWLRHLHGQVTVTLAPSTQTVEQLVRHGINDVVRWGRGVDSDLFHPDRRDERLRRDLAPDGQLLVGFVGRLAKEKRVELLARTSRLPGVQVVVVGGGPAESALRRALPRALFLGSRRGADLARIYASLDVFVHTGPHETFCQTVQEAQASGVAVVAPATGGPLDLVRHGRTGLLVPPCDADAIAAVVDRLAADADQRRDLGRAARAEVAGRTWAAMGDELIAHYESACRAGVCAPTHDLPTFRPVAA